MPLNTNEILVLVKQERERQEMLKADGKFPYTCADYGLPVCEKLSVLTEEVGEVAREINECRIRGHHPDDVMQHDKKLRDELIQVAAVAVAWAESL